MPNHDPLLPIKILSQTKHNDITLEQTISYSTDIFALSNSLDTDHAMKERIRSATENFKRAWILVDRTQSMGVIESRSLNLPSYMASLAAFQRAQQDLHTLYITINEPPLLHIGFSAKDLRTEARIGQGLWQKIIEHTGLPKTKRGECHRRFTDRQIRILILAAERHDTAKSRSAALRWSKLIDSGETK